MALWLHGILKTTLAKSRTWIIPEVWKGSTDHCSQEEAQALGLEIYATVSMVL